MVEARHDNDPELGQNTMLSKLEDGTQNASIAHTKNTISY
mgnify:CR=1 FL=1